MIVRLDGAGASHDFIEHMTGLEIPGVTLLFTCGWTITETDEGDIRKVPGQAWKPGVTQDGHAEDDSDVAEITGLMTRSGNWPQGLRWIIRRVKPSRRHLKNLTAYEKETGWKYSIICTNIPEEGIEGVAGSRHAQFIDVLHRQHAVVEDGVRTGKAAGLRNLPSKSWRVNCGWTVAANIAADLQAWCRLLGLHDIDGLRDAEPDTLRHRLWHVPPARPPRPPPHPEDQPRLAVEGRVPRLLAADLRPARTPMTSTNHPSDAEGGHPGAVGAGAPPGTPGHPCTPPPNRKRT